MTPFVPAVFPEITVEDARRRFANTPNLMNLTDVELVEAIKHLLGEEVYLNDTYQVNVRRFPMDSIGELVHLSIKRIDRQCIHDWRELQTIKNMLVGAECEGVELYPAESRVVDSANQFHLWVVSDPTFRWPFGFEERYVTDAIPHDPASVGQRPLKG